MEEEEYESQYKENQSHEDNAGISRQSFQIRGSVRGGPGGTAESSNKPSSAGGKGMPSLPGSEKRGIKLPNSNNGKNMQNLQDSNTPGSDHIKSEG